MWVPGQQAWYPVSLSAEPSFWAQGRLFLRKPELYLISYLPLLCFLSLIPKKQVSVFSFRHGSLDAQIISSVFIQFAHTYWVTAFSPLNVMCLAYCVCIFILGIEWHKWLRGYWEFLEPVKGRNSTMISLSTQQRSLPWSLHFYFSLG